MKVDELVELFQDTLNGGDDSDDMVKKYHPQVLKAALDMAIETIHSDTIRIEEKNRSFDPIGLDMLTKRVTCVSTNCEKGSFGFDMPTAYQALPSNAGIRIINPTGKFVQFNRIGYEDVFSFSELPAFKQGQWYSVINQRVNLYNLEPKEVDVTYIPKLLGMDGDEEINFLSDGTQIFQVAKTMLGEKLRVLQDNVNNSVPDQ